MKKLLLGIAALGVVSFVGLAWANPACNIDNCQEQGGARWSVGGTLDVISGGDLDIESGGVLSIAGVTVSASAAQLNQAADYSTNVEVVTATNVITAAESGSTFFLNSATEFVSTLPAPAAGLRYKFIIAAAPSTNSYTIVTTSSANIMNMMIVASTADDVGDFTLARDVITFVGTSAPGPSIVGDWIECISDATSWFCSGTESVAEGITVGQSG